MGRIDPERERARLAKVYAEMSDLQLEKVGRDPAQLTDWGRDALAAEMKKRGLTWNPEPIEAKPILPDEFLYCAAKYTNRYRARIDRDLIANAGIRTFFYAPDPADEERTDENALWLLVLAKDLPEVRQLLEQQAKAEAALREHGTEPAGTDRPVLLRRYRDPPEALVEKSALEASGIFCYLQDDNVIRMDWLWSNAMGGIKLFVRETDADEAERILSQQPPTETVEQSD